MCRRMSLCRLAVLAVAVGGLLHDTHASTCLLDSGLFFDKYVVARVPVIRPAFLGDALIV